RLHGELDERDRVGYDGPASDGVVDPYSGDKPL
ncbi:MAG: hypothetical protein JWP90_2027, partial [Mycetocola sp.]|nr:hypothetical protein [Mycetocola sp.]